MIGSKLTRTKIVAFVFLAISVLYFISLAKYSKITAQKAPSSWWEVQSIDTMKFSRDVAREKLNDPSFDDFIETEVEKIAELGATHVAIGTPYDDEFIPFLTRWVNVARKNNLKVWFRGNFSGWEEWFDYPKITPEEHLQKLQRFITNNPELFRDGDIFTTCTECENGGPGDPRSTGDVAGYRNFLVSEYETAKSAFEAINKNVEANYFSMNGDVANLIMDKDTTAKLDGIVVVDHYVGSPERLVADVKSLAQQSGGKVVLGETGVPIPDIHGNLNEDSQAAWYQNALELLSKEPALHGLNYWTASGSSTELFNDDKSNRKITESLESFFKPQTITGTVKNELGNAIEATVTVEKFKLNTNAQGEFEVPTVPGVTIIKVTAENYISKEVSLDTLSENPVIILEKDIKTILHKIILYLNNLLK